MFVRVKTTPNSPRKSVQIVENVRNGDKVKQKILRYVGIATDDSELAKLLDVAEYIKAKIETSTDRDIEFFMFKMFIDSIIEDLFGTDKIKHLGRRSMEEISSMILDKILINYDDTNYIMVSASEDNQVTGVVEYTKQ